MATFTPSFELDLDSDLSLEFANGIYTSLGESVFAPLTVELDSSDLPFEFSAGIYISPGSGVFTTQSVELKLEDMPIEFATGISRSSAPGIFVPKTVELDIGALVYQAGDHTVELTLAGASPPTFYLPPMTEILYPVVPITDQQKVLTRMDSEEIRVTTKVTGSNIREIDTLRFVVDTSSLAAFLADLDGKRLDIFRLQTLDITPFGVNSNDNYVRVVTRTRPQREEGGLAYSVDVTFRFMATYP